MVMPLVFPSEDANVATLYARACAGWISGPYTRSLSLSGKLEIKLAIAFGVIGLILVVILFWPFLRYMAYVIAVVWDVVLLSMSDPERLFSSTLGIVLLLLPWGIILLVEYTRLRALDAD
jgi:hypothetical protein